MFFEPEAVPAELPKILRQCIAITGWPVWKARLRSLDKWVENNPLIEDYLAEKYPLELEMERTHRRIHLGQAIGLPETSDQAALYSLLFMVSRVHQRLSPAGQRRLAGMIRDCLKAEAGLAPLQYEMLVAAHLMEREFDVTFHDMETGGGFDILATQNGLEVEVEAKTLSGDVGRKVHKRRLYQLARHVYPTMKRARDLRTGGQIARVILPGRLLGADQPMREISARLTKVLDGSASDPRPDPCAVEYITFPLEGSPFQRSHLEPPDQNAVQRYVEERIGRENVSMFFVATINRSAVVVTVESRQSDAIMDAMVRALKETAKRQLTGTRPGIICVMLTDLKEAELAMIARQDASGHPSALQVATSQLLDREDWRHLHTVTYMSRGTLVSSQSTCNNTSTQSARASGPSYSFTNPHHELAQDEQLTLFRRERTSATTSTITPGT